MSESPDHLSTNRPVFPWVIVALVVLLAGGGFFWMNQKIEALQAAATAPHQDTSGEEQTKQAMAGLQQAVEGVQSSQQKLVDQVADVQRKLAAEGGERKLMSDQLSALSSRVDALSSAKAEGTAATPRAKRGRQ
jgi:uncharacterized protein YlxW (UPF0749 family)